MEKEFIKKLDNIFILGRGQSLKYCPVEKPENSEIWGCNNIYKARNIDRLFIMRDVYITQFNREKNLIEDINGKDFPVYTLGQYREIKNNVVYPMKEIIKEFKRAYFLNNISYMLALAIMQEPKRILLYGVDMGFGSNVEYMRNGKSCIEYWLGRATGRKIIFGISRDSNLMKRKERNNFYGIIVSKDKNSKVIDLKPEYMFGREKCANKYKIVRIAHTL